MQANNHAVREAACACIGELCVKVSEDAVAPNVPALLAALLVCFRDESWPCRDAAAAGTSALVAAYPAAAAPQLGDLWRLWFEHLGDNVPSVRANAAAAIGKVAGALPEEALKRSDEWLKCASCRVYTSCRLQLCLSEGHAFFCANCTAPFLHATPPPLYQPLQQF
jgi:hypothetical protein